jgi:ribose transport system substrate-binding protein
LSKRLRFFLSLTTDDNDFQREQAAAGREAAGRLGVNLEVGFAESNSVTQSQQLLKVIQGPPGSRPDAILLQPVGGTALPQVGSAAVAAGIGWCVLNHNATYLNDLRQPSKVPVFSVSSDNREIGRIAGQQVAALLPAGGLVLYIQGQSGNYAAQQRAAGMQETKSASIHLSTLRGQWTEGSAYQSVCSWLSLTTSRNAQIDLVAAQNDVMARGARKAIEEQIGGAERERWMSLPFIGVDGLPKTGQSWVRTGLLTATIVVPPNTPLAMEAMAQALEKKLQPSERTYTTPRSFPAINELARKSREN